MQQIQTVVAKPLTIQETEDSLQASIKPELMLSLTSKVNNDFELTGYTLGDDVSLEDIKDAIKAIDAHSHPLSNSEVVGLLQKLRLKVSHRTTDQSDAGAILAVYAEDLRQYPADIVREVLTKYPETNIWWPSWSELASDPMCSI